MKKKALMCALAMMGMSTFITPTVFAEDMAVTTETQEATGVEPRTDYLQWRYKMIDGHLYKRLFNCSTGQWETDWILVQ